MYLLYITTGMLDKIRLKRQNKFLRDYNFQKPKNYYLPHEIVYFIEISRELHYLILIKQTRLIINSILKTAPISIYYYFLLFVLCEFF